MSVSPAVAKAVSKIVVGVDGSDNGRDALTWATSTAVAFGAELVVVHAMGLLERFNPDKEHESATEHRGEIVRRFEQEWCAPLEDVDVRVTTTVEDGPPVMVLLRLAEREGADLIVVGSRGVGGFPSLALGSTSTQVSQHAHVPVAIVPRGDS